MSRKMKPEAKIRMEGGMNTTVVVFEGSCVVSRVVSIVWIEWMKKLRIG